MNSSRRDVVFRVVGAIAVSIALMSCEAERPSVPYDFTELAMVPGMVIEVENKNGRVRIDALGELTRRYRWEGFDERRTLIPRTERFEGRLGAYDPAASSIWAFWKIRIVAEDSLIDFNTADELQARLYEASAILDWVYTDDGLVVGFAKSPDRRQVNIHVYRYLIQGKRPTSMPGSRPELIKVMMPDDLP